MDAAAAMTAPSETRYDWARCRDVLGRPVLPPSDTFESVESIFDPDDVLERFKKVSRATLEYLLARRGKPLSHITRRWLRPTAGYDPYSRLCNTADEARKEARSLDNGTDYIYVKIGEFASDLPEILLSANAFRASRMTAEMIMQLEILQESYRDIIISTTFVAESEPHAGAPPGADPAPRTHLVTATRPCSAGRRGAGHARPSRHPVARRHTAACGTNITMR